MTTEEKARAYDEALKVLHKYDGIHIMFTQDLKEEMFPELKESEDERIRKEMIFYFKEEMPLCSIQEHADKMKEFVAWLEKQKPVETPQWMVDFLDKNRSKFASSMDSYYEQREAEGKLLVIIDWLEKQSGQNPKHFVLKAGHWYICHRAFCCRADHLTVKEGERFMCEKDGIVKGFVVKEPEKYFKEVCAPAPMEDVQKSADKIEPKFKAGDWITNGHCKCQITFIDSRYWYSKTCVLGNVIDIDKTFHLWTIQDARDGDVLVDEDNNIGIYKEIEGVDWNSYIYLGCNNHLYGFSIGGSHVQNNTKPATKEQRDLLFSKMKEASYEWDTEKKELKKIEKQKPAWSEEDEERIKNILSVLDVQVCWNGATGKKENPYQKEIDWIKSLSPQNRWKPSDEQMFARPLTPLRETAEVATRLPHVDDDLKPIAEFIMDYCLWDLRKDNWNQPVIVVPLFRVLDALIQRGKPYIEFLFPSPPLSLQGY